MLVLATVERLTLLRLSPSFCPWKFMETFLDSHFLGYRRWPGSVGQCFNSFDDAESIPISTCRKILGFGHDATAVGLGLGLGYDATAVGLRQNASSVGLELGCDTSTIGLGLGLDAIGELKIGLEVPVGGLGVGIDASSGSPPASAARS